MISSNVLMVLLTLLRHNAVVYRLCAPEPRSAGGAMGAPTIVISGDESGDMDLRGALPIA